MFRVGERLEVMETHPHFHNMSKIWIYNGGNGVFHSISHPITGEKFKLILTATLERQFKRARPLNLENK